MQKENTGPISSACPLDLSQDPENFPLQNHVWCKQCARFYPIFHCRVPIKANLAGREWSSRSGCWNLFCNVILCPSFRRTHLLGVTDLHVCTLFAMLSLWLLFHTACHLLLDWSSFIQVAFSQFSPCPNSCLEFSLGVIEMHTCTVCFFELKKTKTKRKTWTHPMKTTVMLLHYSVRAVTTYAENHEIEFFQGCEF